MEHKNVAGQGTNQWKLDEYQNIWKYERYMKSTQIEDMIFTLRFPPLFWYNRTGMELPAAMIMQIQPQLIILSNI